MPTRLSIIALAVPLVLLAYLLAVPSSDHLWRATSFHFWVTSGACLLAALACAILILSARSMRETRVQFLALAFFTLGMLFSIHGLGTPGFLFDEPYASLSRSPWMATLGAAIFAALSVITLPKIGNGSKIRVPQLIFITTVALTGFYFMMSLYSPNWLAGFPTQDEWFQHTLTVTTVTLLCFAAWRYYQTYQFARLPGQLAVAVGLVFLAEAQLSLDFGILYAYSWWLYHGLFLVAFCTVLLGWFWEVARAKDGRAIAEGLAMRDALAQMNRGRPMVLVSLANQIENHDLETFRHVDRVAAFSYAIGKDLGFSASRLRDLVMAGQMHDVGKIGLPSYILTKPGKLTNDEWLRIKEHPGKGEDIVHRIRDLSSLGAIIRHHHERWDGFGYPDSLVGENIPLESRIISVADTFDALTSKRPYRPAMTIDEAKAELQRVAGAQLDPHLVGIITRLMDNGTLVMTRKELPDEADHDHDHTHEFRRVV
jgi:HD-GYP domain-containing protein (c-di-GMP phosphodiesterase class II)